MSLTASLTWQKIIDDKLLANLFVAISYILLAKTATILGYIVNQEILVWPAAGASFAFVLLLGYRVLPGIFLGTFLGTLSSYGLILDNPALLVNELNQIVLAASVTIQSFAGVWIVRKFGDYPHNFINPMKVVKFFVYGGIFSSLVNPTITLTTYYYVFNLVSAENFFLEWVTWWLTDATSIIVFSMLVIAIVSFEISRKLLVCTLIGSSLILAMGIYYLSISWDRERLDLIFSQQQNTFIDEIIAKQTRYRSLLTSIEALLNSHGEITKENFSLYMQKALPAYPSVSAVSYVVYINDQDKEKFLDDLSIEHGREIRIWQFDDVNNRVQTIEHDQYLTVKYIEPYDIFYPGVGFDVSSSEMRKSALDYSRDNNGLSISAPLSLPVIEDTTSVALYYPVFIEENPEGYASVIIESSVFFSEFTDQPFSDGVVFSLRDTMADENFQYIYQSDLAAASDREVSKITIPLLNREWEFSFARTEEFYQNNYSNDPMITGLIGMIVAALITFATIIFTGNRLYLENKVYERTDALKKANKSKSEFLANMSHDLRTPLNAIIGFSEIINKRMFGNIENPRYAGYIENISSSSEYLLSLINEILDFSVLDAEKRNLYKESFDLEYAVEECYKNLSSLSGEKNITCEITIQKNMPQIYADYKAIMQILINLISNSIKFTPAGGKIMTSISYSKNWINIIINDNGYGINKRDLENILDPFTRVENNPLVTNEGTGLGLSIVKSLVELHEGKLDVKSYQNIGTTVTINLPRV